MGEKQVYNLFKEKGALLEGHFLLTSGLHSSIYLQCAKLLQYPDIAEKLCRKLAGNFKENVDIVIAPAVGGIIVGYEVARALRARAIFAERAEGKMVLRRGFELKKGENVLAVEDVVTTGGSLSEIIELAEEKGCNIMGAGMLVDRSGGEAQFNVKKVALLTLEIKNYPKESCPLCKKGVPIIYLGSRQKKVG
jgi:orotate phosphoribosyltransferase